MNSLLGVVIKLKYRNVEKVTFICYIYTQNIIYFCLDFDMISIYAHVQAMYQYLNFLKYLASLEFLKCMNM